MLKFCKIYFEIQFPRTSNSLPKWCTSPIVSSCSHSINEQSKTGKTDWKRITIVCGFTVLSNVHLSMRPSLYNIYNMFKCKCGGRSVGIVRSRTKATELVSSLVKFFIFSTVDRELEHNQYSLLLDNKYKMVDSKKIPHLPSVTMSFFHPFHKLRVYTGLTLKLNYSYKLSRQQF
jgi:hypothetical protein